MLQETISKLEIRLKRPVEEHEIRKELGMTVQEYGKLMKKVRPISVVSLDQSVDSSSEDSPPLKEAIADMSQAPIQEKVETKEMIGLLKNELPRYQMPPERCSPCIISKACGFLKSPKSLISPNPEFAKSMRRPSPRFAPTSIKSANN